MNMKTKSLKFKMKNSLLACLQGKSHTPQTRSVCLERIDTKSPNVCLPLKHLDLMLSGSKYSKVVGHVTSLDSVICDIPQQVSKSQLTLFNKQHVHTLQAKEAILETEIAFSHATQVISDCTGSLYVKRSFISN